MTNTGSSEPIDFQQLTHEMNNSLAYVVTNLHLLQEELEACDDEAQSARLMSLILDAQEGSERLGTLIRELRRQSWQGSDVVPPKPSHLPMSPTEVKPGKILVIDDEDAILTAVKRALRSHDVETVQDGSSALQLLKENQYDLLLCDLIMGGLTGIDLYTTLKQTRPKVAARVVFMTAGGFTPEARTFLNTVNNSVLHKPFDVKTLRWMVNQKLGEFSRL